MELCRSSAVLTKLADPSFQRFWDHLYESCPWKTCFQTRAYVETWYRCYQQVAEPVLVFSLDPARPSILPLANSKEGLVVAGGRQAEYHCWLAPRADSDFIADLCRLLNSEFSWRNLTFRYLPAGFPEKSLQRFTTEVEEHRRPLMQVSSIEDISISLKKKGNKSKLNGLKKHGELNFEYVSDVSRLQVFLDDVIAMYDFRQAAVNHSVPFERDPLKRTFFLAMAQFSALTHCTILRIGEKPIAAHFGRISADKIHLGIFAHSPLYAQYSPGKFHLMFLGMMLHEQGFGFLDLTPGGDDWKERFATEHDSVFLLKIHRSHAAARLRQLQNRGLQTTKQVLQMVRVSPQQIRSCLHFAKDVSSGRVTRRLRYWVRHDSNLVFYRLARGEIRSSTKPGPTASDSIRDLMQFQPHEPYADRFEFLSVCLSRLESGVQHIHTRTQGGALVQYAWMAQGEVVIPAAEIGCEVELGEESVVLFDFYLAPGNPSREAEFQAMIVQLLNDVLSIPTIKEVYLPLSGQDVSLARAVEHLGFQRHGDLSRSVRFGRDTKSSSGMASPKWRDVARGSSKSA